MYPSSCWKSQIHLVTLSSPTVESPVVVVTTTSLMPAAMDRVSSSNGRLLSPAVPPQYLVGDDDGASGDNGGVHGSGAV